MNSKQRNVLRAHAAVTGGTLDPGCAPLEHEYRARAELTGAGHHPNRRGQIQ